MIASAYLVVFALIANAVRRQRQWRTNPLAVATAGLFLTGGIGHWLRVVDLVQAGPDGTPPLIAGWDALTGAVAVGYVSLRHRLALLLRDGRMYEDQQHLQAERQFRTAFDHAPIGMALVDPASGRLTRVNPSLAELLRHDGPAEDVALTGLLHPDDRRAVRLAAERVLRHDAPVHVEARLVCGDELRPVVVSLASVPHDDAPLLVAHVVDVSDRKRFEGRLRHLADHDALTGLPNRRRFEQDLDRALALRRRYGGTAALLMLDLDGFKVVNDTLGHAAGDELIIRVGAVLRSTLRDTDVLARLGGDEYAILLPEASATEAGDVAAKARLAVRAHALGGAGPQVTASVGIVVLDGTGTVDDALIDADLAMYAVKDDGRDGWRVFSEDDGHRERLSERAMWVERLRAAPADGRLELVAQPILALDAPRAKPTRFELLLRYVDDDGDLVPPGAFLAIAERFDLIGELDRWVLGEAVRRLHALQAAGRDVAFHVNLSGSSVADPALCGALRRLVTRWPVAPGSLVVEVTETAAISNMRHARDFSDTLQELGLGFALDDFGAGFASFSYLKHLRFDYVKIDGEFVRGLEDSSRDHLVVQAIVDIARGMGIETVAEFVSGDACVAALRELGVGHGQGYHLGRPARLGQLGLTAPARVAP